MTGENFEKTPRRFFRPIVGVMYDNRSERGGRPNIDEVVMVKLLVLQQWYGL